jgi:hypothetical protein
MSLPPIPHTTVFQDSKTGRISQPWLQWLEFLRQEATARNEQGTLAHTDLTGVTADQHHDEVHTHTSSTAISHLDLSTVTTDQHHAKSHIHDGADGSGLVNYFGSVVSETSYGQASVDGVLGTISRSDHTHGTPAASGTQALASFRQIAGSTWSDRWYLAPEHVSGASATTANHAANVLFAVPFLSGQNTAISGLGLYHDTVANDLYHVGIYTNTSNSYLYPDALIVDVLVNPTGAGFFSTSTTATIPANSLLWAVFVGDSAALLSVIATASAYKFLGRSSSQILSSSVSSLITVAFTYAALPSTFPAGAAISTSGTLPCIALRYSA